MATFERIAPLAFAEAWDNVGLLIEPYRERQRDVSTISQLVLTIDLDDGVVSEAQAVGAELIVAYHPPIFSGLKRIRSSQPEERCVARCLAHGIAVFSPHTALDAAPAGVNDWLLDAFGAGQRSPCVPHPRDARFGQGRRLELIEPLSLELALERVKAHLGLAHLRVAAAERHVAGELLKNVAVCAGSGGSVFEQLDGFDLYVTGELRHHDVRSKLARGASVLLCDHSNTERGYLPRLAQRIARECDEQVVCHVAHTDREPLRVL